MLRERKLNVSNRMTTEELKKLLAESTPGPWRYQENSDAYTHIVRAGIRWIVQFSQDTSGISEANARLTAAAPSLAAELIGLRERERWIPTSERLPDCAGPFLFVAEREVGVGMFFSTDPQDWGFSSELGCRYTPEEVTHWRELPCPPSETEKETTTPGKV
jgi:Protein of unknown function (DUF551)